MLDDISKIPKFAVTLVGKFLDHEMDDTYEYYSLYVFRIIHWNTAVTDILENILLSLRKVSRSSSYHLKAGNVF